MNNTNSHKINFSFIRLIRLLRIQYLNNKAKKRIANKATLIGENHQIVPEAKILLEFGATQANIVLDEHSELFGKIIGWGPDCNVKIGKWAKVGYNCTITCVDNIEIGDYTAIADGVTIVDHNYHPINPADRKYMRTTPHGSIERSPLFSEHKPIIIGENVMLGHNVRVCKGVTIGDNCIIGANSIVTKNIPSNCIAAGIPAKIVKENIDLNTTPIFPLNK